MSLVDSSATAFNLNGESWADQAGDDVSDVAPATISGGGVGADSDDGFIPVVSRKTDDVSSSAKTLPYELTLKEFKAAHTAFLDFIVNKFDKKSPVWKLLTDPETRDEYIVKIVGPPNYVEGKIAHGTSGADQFWKTHSIRGVTHSRDGTYDYQVAHQLFALFAHGVDAMPFPKSEAFEDLENYLPKVKTGKEMVLEILDSIDTDRKYELLKEKCPLLLRVQIHNAPSTSPRDINPASYANVVAPVTLEQLFAKPAPVARVAGTPSADEIVLPSAVSTTPVFDGKKLSLLLSLLSGLVGKTPQELEIIHSAGGLSPLALKLLA